MKKVADTLAKILEHPDVKIALDRTEPLELAYVNTMEYWRVDLENRNPRPAYQQTLEGELFWKETDLDLFTFLNELAIRNARVNIPDYERISPKTFSPDQKLISDKNRHGEIMGIIGNQDAHSFSVRIKDYNVVQINPDGSETIGAPRNFAMVDYSGELRDSWKVQLDLNKKESDFIEKKKLSADGVSLRFKYFVHPNKAFSFYGSPYLITQILGRRIKDEARHYRLIEKQLRKEGIKLDKNDPTLALKPFEHFGPEQEGGVSVAVENLEAIVTMPQLKGKYPLRGLDPNGMETEYDKMPNYYVGKRDVLRYSQDRARNLSYHYGPRINAVKRAVELAFFKYGFYGRKREYGNEIQPSWEIPKWQRECKLGNGRIKWNTLQLNDDITLAYRIKQTYVKQVA
jgi:hypothetical protein